MKRRWVLLRLRVPAGLGLLAMVASCLPQADIQSQPQRVPIAAATMIKRLALDLPADVVSRLPALADAGGPVAALASAPPLFALTSTQSPDDATRAIDCLTAAVYYEARSQSEDGQRAVAQVVLNRVRDRAFPNSVCGVVYQGSQRRTGCQFSFTCDGSMAYRRDEAAWARARTIAVAALSGQVYAPVGSATFYHANYVLPWWASSMDRVATVGAHIFYRWSGGMERALAYSQSYSGSEPSVSGRTTPWPVAEGSAALAYNQQETVGGVTIHRGAVPTASAATAPVAAAAISAPVPAVPQGKRIRVMADAPGVKVHRGESAPPPVATTD